MEEQTHCQGDPTMIKGPRTTKDVTVLPDKVFARTTITPEEAPQDEEQIKAWVDPHKLKKINDIWYHQGQQVVTGDIEERRTIIKNKHDLPVHGHPGISKTVQIIERTHWWPQMKQDIVDYVKGCADCQRMKVNNRPTKAPLQPIYPRPEAMPFETVTLDFIVKLPVSSGYDSILTITDHDCTKASVFIPCNEEITAEGTAALYLKHVFVHYGLPAKMISDRDPRFTSNSSGKFVG